MAGGGYGMGMWLDDRPGVAKMQGMDAGVSFGSVCRPDRSVVTVVANSTEGAWSVLRRLDGGDADPTA